MGWYNYECFTKLQFHLSHSLSLSYSLSRSLSLSLTSYSFVVRAEERNIYLRAKSLSKLNYWRNGLNLHIDLINGGSIQGPKCQKNQRKVIKGGAKAVSGALWCGVVY